MPNAQNLRPFRPGQSGNPGGRPKSLLTGIRQHVGHDGEKLVEAWATIAFGTATAIRKQFGRVTKVTTRDRLMAMKELADRGWGRPLVAVTMEVVPEGRPLRHVSDEALKAQLFDRFTDADVRKLVAARKAEAKSGRQLSTSRIPDRATAVSEK